QIFLCQVGSGLDEALRVERDTAIQPAGICLGPGHQENVLDVVTRYGPCACAPLHAFEVPVSLESHDLGSRSELDGRGLLDAADQISRHAFGKTAGSDEHVNPSRRLRQEYRGLTGRVGAADDDDLVALADLRFFHERGVVVDTGAFELPEIRERRLTVSGAR